MGIYWPWPSMWLTDCSLTRRKALKLPDANTAAGAETETERNECPALHALSNSHGKMGAGDALKEALLALGEQLDGSLTLNSPGGRYGYPLMWCTA